MIERPFSHPTLRDWLFSKLEIYETGFTSISTLGSGPFDEEDFDEFLDAKGFDLLLPGEGTEVLVIGYSGWTPEQLRELLDQKAGESLRVYAQEMLLTYLMTGHDPLEEDEDFLRTFGSRHPALEFLMDGGFEWPITTISPGGETRIEPADWRKVGPLGFYGYRVGSSGLATSRRRSILRLAYENELPSVFPKDVVDKWGY